MEIGITILGIYRTETINLEPSRFYNDMTGTLNINHSPFNIKLYITRSMTKEEVKEYGRQGHLQKTKTTLEKFEETQNNQAKNENGSELQYESSPTGENRDLGEIEHPTPEEEIHLQEYLNDIRTDQPDPTITEELTEEELKSTQ